VQIANFRARLLKALEIYFMCKCSARGFTVCLVCCGLLLAPFGAKNPPASAVGHVLTAASSTGTVGNVHLWLHTIPNTVTGATNRFPLEIRVAMYEPGKHVAVADIVES
jgi:hypothetical protein